MGEKRLSVCNGKVSVTETDNSITISGRGIVISTDSINLYLFNGEASTYKTDNEIIVNGRHIIIDTGKEHFFIPNEGRVSILRDNVDVKYGQVVLESRHFSPANSTVLNDETSGMN